MKRSQVLLSVLAGLLLVALFYVLLFQPAREELAEVEVQIVDQEQQQQALAGEIARLQSVREEAPEVEAEVAAAEAIVPRDASLPAALRQLQLAADDSNVVLQAVTTSRPVPVDGRLDGLSSIDVNLQLVGGYFQTVDFLRRIEDPAISPRGLAWNNVAVVRQEAYPSLDILLTGSLYAVLSSSIPPEAPTAPDPDAEEAAGDDAEVDVEVEVDDAAAGEVNR